jgi:hypothetical protein
MYISKDYFDDWMKRIIEQLKAIDGRLVTAIRADQRIEGDVILDNEDLLKILKVSVRTLQRIRNSGKLPYHTMNKKNYYLKSDVEKYIREFIRKDSSSTDCEAVEV